MINHVPQSPWKKTRPTKILPTPLQQIEDAKGNVAGDTSKKVDKIVAIKAAKKIGGMLVGHDLLLTALPFLRRFVKSRNVFRLKTLSPSSRDGSTNPQ